MEQNNKQLNKPSKKKYLVTSIVSVAVLSLLITAGTSFAYSGPGNAPEEIQQKHEEMKTIFDNGDFDAWKADMETKANDILDSITEENFDKIVEIHNLKQAGEFEAAKSLAEELDMPMHKGMGGGHGQGMGIHRGGPMAQEAI